MQLWDSICATGEFICDTPEDKRERCDTMATNFGTKIGINAYKCISTRDNENVITVPQMVDSKRTST